MRNYSFTDKQKQILSKNKNIKKVNEYTVEFTAKFKLYSLQQQDLGCVARMIFEEASIPEWLNQKTYARDCLKRWRRICIRDKSPFNKKSRGRPKKLIYNELLATKYNLFDNNNIDSKKLTNTAFTQNKKQFNNLVARIKYLEEEVDFLKKLKALENLDK